MFSRLSTKGIPEYCTSLTGNALLRTDQLTVQFGQQPVLENINLSLKPGRIVTLIGPNGSGKSTLVKALIGAIKPTAGHIASRSYFSNDGASLYQSSQTACQP